MNLKNKMPIRTRFSPSPTGHIHLGNMRAALFSVLFALKNQGRFVLRIEDTDVQRSDDKYIQSIQVDLKWLGLNWQEGPYLQSKRGEIYEKYYHQLEMSQLIYPCFCSDQELMLARKAQLAKGIAPRYAGTCKRLTKEEVASHIAAGQKPAWRLLVPLEKEIEFVDLVKGKQIFHSREIGDFIVRRQDGTASFLFCNAVDDAEMKITHVFRGEDHLTNTPRQILVLEALGLTPPSYGHLSLIVGDAGAPLSKRQGSFSIDEMRSEGYLPVAITNYLARLGHAMSAQDLMTLDTIATHFETNQLSRSPSRFDLVQLMYWQKIAVQSLDESSLLDFLGDTVLSLVPESKRSSFVNIIKTNIAFPKEAAHWANIFFHALPRADEEKRTILHQAGTAFFNEAIQAVLLHGAIWQDILATLQVKLNLSGKKLLMPLRIALTGEAHGPALHDIAMLLGEENMKSRLEVALKYAER